MADFPAVTHLALTVTDLDVSLPWYERLFGVASFASGLALRDPDNIALEFFAPPAA